MCSAGREARVYRANPPRREARERTETSISRRVYSSGLAREHFEFVIGNGFIARRRTQHGPTLVNHAPVKVVQPARTSLSGTERERPSPAADSPAELLRRRRVMSRLSSGPGSMPFPGKVASSGGERSLPVGPSLCWGTKRRFGFWN